MKQKHVFVIAVLEDGRMRARKAHPNEEKMQHDEILCIYSMPDGSFSPCQMDELIRTLNTNDTRKLKP